MRTRLEEISESIDYGVTASAADTPVGPKFLRITDIQDGTVDWESVPWCECEDRQAKSARLHSGDIVFARTGATTGKSYLISECPSDAVFASYLIRVRLRAMAEPRYVSQFFQSQDYWSQITKGARGAAQPGVNATTLKSLEIPLPPLAEQKRIAGILDAADALRAKRRAALAQLDALAQSLFLDLFGDPVTNPKGWEVVRLGSICDVGSSKRVFVNELVEAGIPFYRGTEIGQMGDGLEVTPSLFITREHYEALKTDSGVPSKGDLLMPSICPDGRIYIVENDEPFYFKDGRVLWVKVDATRISSTFLRNFLKNLFFADYAKIASGTTFAELKIFALKDIRVQSPPLPLQQQFAAAVEAIERQKVRHREQLAGLDALFASLQHRAFRGEL